MYSCMSCLGLIRGIDNLVKHHLLALKVQKSTELAS